VQKQPTIAQYASTQIASRMGRLVFESKRCARSLDADAVHDLRVSIRRFNQSLRTFLSLLPGREARKVRRQARKVMRLAGEVRNLDVALEWLAKAGITRRSPLWNRLNEQRRAAERGLAETLKQNGKRDFSSRWRSSLRLDGA